MPGCSPTKAPISSSPVVPGRGSNRSPRKISAAGGVAEAAEVDALDEDATDKHMDDVVARAQRIDVLFNAIGMDDVQGILLVDMSAEDFAQPVIRLRGPSSSPRPITAAMGSPAPRSKGCGGVSPRSSDHTGSGSSSCGRPGLRTRQTSSRPSSITPRPPGSLPRSSWPKRAAEPCFVVFRCCPRWPRPPS